MTESAVWSINLCCLYLSECILHPESDNVMWWGGLECHGEILQSTCCEWRLLGKVSYKPELTGEELTYKIQLQFISLEAYSHQSQTKKSGLTPPAASSLSRHCLLYFPFPICHKMCSLHHPNNTDTLAIHSSCFWRCQHTRKTHHHLFITPSLERAMHISIQLLCK